MIPAGEAVIGQSYKNHRGTLVTIVSIGSSVEVTNEHGRTDHLPLSLELTPVETNSLFEQPAAKEPIVVTLEVERPNAVVTDRQQTLIDRLQKLIEGTETEGEQTQNDKEFLEDLNQVEEWDVCNLSLAEQIFEVTTLRALEIIETLESDELCEALVILKDRGGSNEINEALLKKRDSLWGVVDEAYFDEHTPLRVLEYQQEVVKTGEGSFDDLSPEPPPSIQEAVEIEPPSVQPESEEPTDIEKLQRALHAMAEAVPALNNLGLEFNFSITNRKNDVNN